MSRNLVHTINGCLNKLFEIWKINRTTYCSVVKISKSSFIFHSFIKKTHELIKCTHCLHLLPITLTLDAIKHIVFTLLIFQECLPSGIFGLHASYIPDCCSIGLRLFFLWKPYNVTYVLAKDVSVLFVQYVYWSKLNIRPIMRDLCVIVSWFFFRLTRLQC